MRQFNILTIYKQNKFLLLPLAIIVVITIFTLLVKSYFSDTISYRWQEVSSEKQKEVSDKCLEAFYSYQMTFRHFLFNTSDRKLIAALKSQNTKKPTMRLWIIGYTKYNVEVYNPG
jgi:hypothetical protein